MRMMHAEWMLPVLENAFDEVFIIDCTTLHFIFINHTARSNLQYQETVLSTMRLPDLSGSLTMHAYSCLLQTLDRGSCRQISFDTVHVRMDGTTYPVNLRLCRADVIGSASVYIVTGHNLSDQREATLALLQSEARCQAIVSHAPGLVFQLLMPIDASLRFTYLSEGCHALLGMDAVLLQSDASHFLNLILAPDQITFNSAMRASAVDQKSWNWAGRIWIEAWKDIKWINVRATPHGMPDGSVQWEGIMTNITESKQEVAEIKQAQTQLAELSTHVEMVKEQERTRIAREIHDDLGGNLTAIKMSLALLTRRLPDDRDLIDKAEYLDSLVDRTIESVHRIAGDLRPGILDLGLVAAIDWQTKEFAKQIGITCVFSSNRKNIKLHQDQATALFRIFQEALTNISKHAHATKVQVKLVRGIRKVHLQITDNGYGIAATDRLKPNSFGIRGMVERANALGGELSIKNGQSGGSVVSVGLSLPPTHRPARKSSGPNLKETLS